jgi:hypothetical protein
MHNPAQFAGRLVKLRATVEAGFEYSVIVDRKDPSCNGPWFEYALAKDETRPFVIPEDLELQQAHPVFRVEDGNFKQFQEAQSARVYSRTKERMTLGNMGGHRRYDVTATMTGRVDFAGNSRNGFGQMGGWRVRFLLASVEDVTAQELPYDWSKFSREPVRFPQGEIHGKLTDAQGQPMKFAKVEAITPEGKVSENEPWALTNTEGSYSLHVEPGQYFVVVDRTEAATEEHPFMATYYPSAEDKSSAALLNIADGAKLVDINIQMSRVLTPRFIDILVVGPDDKPVGNALVRLTETGRDGIAGLKGLPRSDAGGQVRLLKFEGLDYLLWAESYDLPGAQCAPVVRLERNREITGPIHEKITLDSQTCSNQWEDAVKARRTALFP